MPRSHIITGLDIGSGFVKLLSVRRKTEGEGFEILGQAQETSAGIRKGVVISVPKAAEIISSLVDKVERESGEKIEHIYANIGGGHIFSTSSRGLISVSRADQKISEEDVERVLQAAKTFHLPSNKEILDIFPKEYSVDGEPGVKEAVGMQGVRLEAEVLVLCGFSPYLRNSTQAILNSGLQINELIPTPLASAKSVLTPREKELGVMILDIGAGTTDLAVFEEGGLIHTTIFPIGSGHITNDIAICLKTDIDSAERVKLEYGSCFLRKTGRQEKQLKIDNDDNLNFSSKTLNDIIEARVSEILGLANKELKKISRQGLLPAGIVLTGGGAKLPGIRDLAKDELKLPCRIGRPLGFSSLPDEPSLAVLCGLVLQGNDLEGGQESGFSEIGKGIKNKLKKVFKIFIP